MTRDQHQQGLNEGRAPTDPSVTRAFVDPACVPRDPRIEACTITADHGRATMRVRLTDDTEVDAISWYLDELTFTVNDALGLTVHELRALCHARDLEYLRS